MRLFERSELERRADRAREGMDRHGLDAVLVTGDFSAGMNYYYLSGHLPRDYQLNYSRPHVMVFPKDGSPFLWIYGLNVENARIQSWVDDVRTYDPPFSGKALADAIVEQGLGSATIGVELGVDQRLFLPLAEYQAMEAALPAVSFVDAAPFIWGLRMIKSEAEVGYIREADRINGAALELGFGDLTPGDSEVDVARRIAARMVEAGAVRPPYAQILVVSHAKSRALGHPGRMLGPLEEFHLEAGDLLFVDSGAVVAGYWGEFNRMAVVGEPTERQSMHHRNIIEIVERSIGEALRPGVTYRRVIELMVGYYRDLGYDEHQFWNYLGPPFMHLCHGIGLASSEPPFVRYDSEETLEPGMVVSCEAYLRDEDMTYGTESDVLITEGGAEVLSGSDPGLFSIGA
jgi:Xaa-Pro aminopeptidase